MRLGFTYQNFVGGRAVMKWEPPCINFPAIFSNISIDLSKYTLRQKIEIIEWYMLKTIPNIAKDLAVEHFVYDGVYCRAMAIPKNVLLTGKIHLEEHVCLLEKGDLSVMTDEGIKRIHAPYKFKASAGLKKIGYAHEDCIFITYHKTDLTDIEEIERTLFSDGDISWVDAEMRRVA
jgi:hypothetical protein